MISPWLPRHYSKRKSFYYIRKEKKRKPRLACGAIQASSYCKIAQQKQHSKLNILNTRATNHPHPNPHPSSTTGSLKQLRQLYPSTIYVRNPWTSSVTMKNVKTKRSTSFITLAKQLGLQHKGSRSKERHWMSYEGSAMNPPSHPAIHSGRWALEWKAYVGVPFPSEQQPLQHIDPCYPGTRWQEENQQRI